MFKFIKAWIAVYRAIQEARFPSNIKRIDGELYAYCHIRKMWRKIKFHGET